MYPLPNISVLIPTYNSEKYIEESLQSVLQQSLKPSEIIVVDDGSNDGTLEILLSYKNIKVISQKKKGVAFTRNTALAESTGEFIAFQDADDLWLIDKLKLQYECLCQNPEIDLVFCKMSNFIDSQIKDKAKLYWKQHLESNIDPLGLQTMLARRSVFEKVGTFNPELAFAEDLDWFSRLEERGLRKTIMSEVLVKRRLHDSNTTLLSAEDQQKMRLKLIQASLSRQRAK